MKTIVLILAFFLSGCAGNYQLYEIRRTQDDHFREFAQNMMAIRGAFNNLNQTVSKAEENRKAIEKIRSELGIGEKPEKPKKAESPKKEFQSKPPET